MTALLKDFTMNRWGTPRPGVKMDRSKQTHIGFNTSIFIDGEAVTGKTGGKFKLIIEKIELF